LENQLQLLVPAHVLHDAALKWIYVKIIGNYNQVRLLIIRVGFNEKYLNQNENIFTFTKLLF